jgi:glucokinase
LNSIGNRLKPGNRPIFFHRYQESGLVESDDVSISAAGHFALSIIQSRTSKPVFYNNAKIFIKPAVLKEKFMQGLCMKILVDIGGTYARFGMPEAGRVQHIQKYTAADFRSFEEAIASYMGGAKKASLLISTAASRDGKIWRFVNSNKWIIDTDALARAGYETDIILNDFEAATWGLAADEKSIRVLKQTQRTHRRMCLVGPGTGLGLGYLVACADGRFAVQKTMGGHMPAAAVTAEQTLVLQAVARNKERPGIAVYEDVVSGKGLLDLYAAMCEIDGVRKNAVKAEEVPDLDTPQGRGAVRLFHEFFALFAATVAVSGDAFGGLYLTGGLVDRLADKGLFDFLHFERFFSGGFVPSVEKALQETGVFHVTDPYIALKGLIRATDG